MSEHFDIAVIGSGPGGYIAALKAAQRGAKVAVVEKHHLGGSCLNYGCIPSKALLATAQLVHEIRQAGQLGVRVKGEASVDWSAVQDRKDKVVKTLRGGIEGLFRARKVKLFRGRGVLNGPGKVAVLNDVGSAAEQFTASKIILAVGSVPSRIPGWPEDPSVVCTSDESLHWKELPKRLLIVGGGVIGCEFACMLEPLGVDVTVVEMMPQLLPGLDLHLSGGLAEVFGKRKIQVFAGTKVEDLKTGRKGVTAVLSNGKKIDADKVLVATGRRPNTAELGLDSVGLQTDRGFLRVNDKMETPAKGIYCVGDANGRCLLAHAASAHGMVAVENALGGDRAFDAPVPNCVYTFPEIGTVGMTEQQARAKKLPIAIGTFPYRNLGKAMAVGHTDGFVKVLRHRETDEVLGVHMLGHNVTECIAAAGAMLHEKARMHDVAELVAAHPTMSEALKESAEDALGMALHLPPRKVYRIAVGG